MKRLHMVKQTYNCNKEKQTVFSVTTTASGFSTTVHLREFIYCLHRGILKHNDKFAFEVKMKRLSNDRL